MKRTLKLAAAALGAALLVPAFATAAHADASDCEKWSFCFFYNSNQQGSHDTLGDSVPNLAGYIFTSPGNGQGQPVKNNAASVVNNGCPAHVYFNSNFSGPNDFIPMFESANLENTYNENASLSFTTQLCA
ncbi:peptidase inhibitor family I36 protein [Kitasatospora sp. NPDC088346]|uniref:peptidase inhibitor family I36 protein n=1 Tax=Kitasatospora sp. NPDC088346 TaxID=3364073 RepID=UPI0037F18582